MTNTPSPTSRTFPPSSASVAGSWQRTMAAWHRPSRSPLHAAVLRAIVSLALVAGTAAGAGCAADDAGPQAPRRAIP